MIALSHKTTVGIKGRKVTKFEDSRKGPQCEGDTWRGQWRTNKKNRGAKQGPQGRHHKNGQGGITKKGQRVMTKKGGSTMEDQGETSAKGQRDPKGGERGVNAKV